MLRKITITSPSHHLIYHEHQVFHGLPWSFHSCPPSPHVSPSVPPLVQSAATHAARRSRHRARPPAAPAAPQPPETAAERWGTRTRKIFPKTANSFQMLSDWVADVCDGDGVEASWGGGEVEAFGSKSSVVIKVDLRCQACAQNIRGNSNFQHFEAGDTSFKIDFAEALSLQ